MSANETVRDHVSSRPLLGLIRGREPGFEDGDYYEATIRVRISTRAFEWRNDELRGVADRAALAAAGAYNLADTRITAIRLESIEADHS